MHTFNYSVCALICLISSYATAAEWKNPDQQPPAGWQNPDRSASPAQPAPTRPPRVAPAAPALPSGTAGIVTTWFCDMEQTYDDKGSGGIQDVKFFLPVVPPGYRILGGYAQGNHHGPSGCALAAKPQDEASKALMQPPLTWRQIWTDENSGARMDGSIWHPQAASSDYVCIGSVAKQGYSAPNLPNYACLHQCLIEEVPVAGYIWSDEGTGASQDVSVYHLHNSNSFLAVPSHSAPGALVDIRRDTTCEL